MGQLFTWWLPHINIRELRPLTVGSRRYVPKGYARDHVFVYLFALGRNFDRQWRCEMVMF